MFHIVARYLRYPAKISSPPSPVSTTFTFWLASCETKCNATLEGQTMGSSSCQISCGRLAKKSSGPRMTSLYSAPICFATIRAYGNSLYWSSAYPTEKVWIRSCRIEAMVAAIALESRPPLENTPSGTSLIR